MVFCLECLQEVEYDVVVEKRTLQVRDLQIEFDEKIPKCKCCGERVFVKEIDDENLSTAYDLYKKEKGLLTSKEIKDIREKYDLTQVQMARLLGLGEKTIARYENGAIQETSINTLIKLIEDEDVFKKVLEMNGNNINVEDLMRIKENMHKSYYSDVIVLESGVSHKYNIGNGFITGIFSHSSNSIAAM